VKFLRNLAFVCVLAMCASASRAALTADELVLIVNKNVPAGVKTAEYYAKTRLVPPGRIVQLDLPANENVHFWQYEQDVVPTVRKFLRDNGLEEKVKCAVTFFGVPIRISPRTLTPEEETEVTALKIELADVAGKLAPLVRDAEKTAGELDPSFTPVVGEDAGDLSNRANHALVNVARRLPPASDPRHNELLPKLVRLTQQFGGDAQIAEKLSDAEIKAMLPADVAKNWPARRGEIKKVAAEVEQLHDKRFDAPSRKRLRALMEQNYGLFGLLDSLQAQIEYLTTDGTVSAFDSELALLWWKYYGRPKWQLNPLNVRYTGPPPPRTLMVSRLDGPQEGTASQIILGSLKAEREGLVGRVVIDSMGGLQPDGRPDKEGGYRLFDQKLLNLAQIVSTQTKMPLTLDKRYQVLPPHSVRDVAVYCGWYSVRNYVPACEFKAGAVGYHIASFEMLSLRTENEKGWVAGLLNDGIAATCGAVAEPYLAAMPSPDEFFPLLLTGKLTLAECYWKTVPMTSWMMSLVGDPLYTPFKVNPQLREDQLSDLLRRAFKDAPAPGPTPSRSPAVSVETPPPQP
jgi:uncharacterized protein (TIGR03790 family)